MKEEKRTPCPCCGNYTLVGDYEDFAYDICPVCFWECDSITDAPEHYSGPNHMTLGEGRENYRKFGSCDENSIDSVRPPKYYELPEFNE